MEEARTQELVKFVGSGWEVVHLAVATVIDGFKKRQIKPKDAAIVGGIYFDKILQAESRLAPQSQSTETITFKFVSDGTENRPLPDAREIPHLPEPISSDDMRVGGGEDLLRLPGSSQNGPGVP